MTRRRIGLIGLGLIGRYVYDALTRDEAFEIAFVHDNDAARLADLPQDVVLGRLEEFRDREASTICELAHPDVSRQWGETFLEAADYFALSVTALGDAGLERRLRQTARANGTTLFVPHGSVVGLDAILDGGDAWKSISIEMRKNPRNLDFRASGIDGDSISETTTLYDGPTRGVCTLFPRNVNTHATLALAGVGMDRTRSVLVADPHNDAAIIAISAKGSGVELEMRRTESITGVSGATTPHSVLESIRRSVSNGSDLVFC